MGSWTPNQNIWGQEDGRKSVSLHLTPWADSEVIQDRLGRWGWEIPCESSLRLFLLPTPKLILWLKEITGRNSTNRHTAYRGAQSPSRNIVPHVCQQSWEPVLITIHKQEISDHWFSSWVLEIIGLMDVILNSQEMLRAGGSSTGDGQPDAARGSAWAFRFPKCAVVSGRLSPGARVTLKPCTGILCGDWVLGTRPGCFLEPLPALSSCVSFCVDAVIRRRKALAPE